MHDDCANDWLQKSVIAVTQLRTKEIQKSVNDVTQLRTKKISVHYTCTHLLLCGLALLFPTIIIASVNVLSFALVGNITCSII